MTNKYLLILGIGHLLGDFYLQKERITGWKERKFIDLLLYSFKYYIATILVVLPIFSFDMFLAATYASIIHFIIVIVEYVLIMTKRIKKSGRIFIVNQSMHAISFFVLAYIMNEWNFSIGQLKIADNILNTYGSNAETVSRWLFAILLIHIPVNIFIQNFLEDYKPKETEAIIKADNKAGRRIGTIERLIMLVFLSMDQYTAIGFILTAKSIARYDKITKDEKFAEYYLLGTLLSTLCVIICRVLVFIE